MPCSSYHPVGGLCSLEGGTHIVHARIVSGLTVFRWDRDRRGSRHCPNHAPPLGSARAPERGCQHCEAFLELLAAAHKRKAPPAPAAPEGAP